MLTQHFETCIYIYNTSSSSRIRIANVSPFINVETSNQACSSPFLSWKKKKVGSRSLPQWKNMPAHVKFTETSFLYYTVQTSASNLFRWMELLYKGKKGESISLIITLSRNYRCSTNFNFFSTDLVQCFLWILTLSEWIVSNFKRNLNNSFNLCFEDYKICN